MVTSSLRPQRSAPIRIRQAFAIIGVLPRDFHFATAEPADFRASARSTADWGRGCHNLFGVARLKDGVTFATAFSDIETIAQNLVRQYPDSVELSIAVVLLVGAGLLGKSFYRLLHVDTGLDHLATLQAATVGDSYKKDELRINLQRQLRARLSRLPGVTSVAFSSQLPLGDGDGTTGFRIVGRPYPESTMKWPTGTSARTISPRSRRG